MTYIHWSENYLTGIEPVDAQHRRLVELINASATRLASEQVADRATDLLDELSDYVTMHFGTEERLMRELGIDPRHLAHHRASHAEFGHHVAALRQQYDAGKDIGGVALLKFLSNWLVFHILGEDQRMARELRLIESGMNAVDAYEELEGTKAEILQGANDVLVSALVNLFTQLTEQNRDLAEKHNALEAAHGELEKHRQNLEREVVERTLQLLHAKEQAEAASKAKSRFLGMISHELLTPLNAILGFAHLLERADIPGKQKDQAKRIVRASEQLSGLLNEVLQFSRLENDDVRPDDKPFQVASVITACIERNEPLARTKGIGMVMTLEPGLPAISGDANLLTQALEALINNAVKFTEHGVVHIAVRLIAEDADRVNLLFEVKDNGIGIAPDQRHLLFQPFNALDDGNTRKHQGVGMGLAIGSRIARLLGGTLTLTGNADNGSLFSLSLWFGKAEASAQPSPLNDDAPRALPQKLADLKELLKEDNLAAKYLFIAVKPHIAALDAETADLLARQIERYEFQAALGNLERLIARHSALLDP